MHAQALNNPVGTIEYQQTTCHARRNSPRSRLRTYASRVPSSCWCMGWRSSRFGSWERASGTQNTCDSNRRRPAAIFDNLNLGKLIYRTQTYCSISLVSWNSKKLHQISTCWCRCETLYVRTTSCAQTKVVDNPYLIGSHTQEKLSACPWLIYSDSLVVGAPSLLIQISRRCVEHQSGKVRDIAQPSAASHLKERGIYQH